MDYMVLSTGVTNIYALFIDCNCMETSRPGGGPSEEGANAARWHPDVQRSYYNGWKSIHGLKHQTVDCAYGLTVDMYGPTSLRRNDLTLFRASRISDRMLESCARYNQHYDYCIFGDSAYHQDINVRSYLPGNTAEEREWNNGMRSVRISIEWNYLVTANLWHYVTEYNKLCLLQSPVVSKIYVVATLLRNFYGCSYGNQTSNYFGYKFPEGFLTSYINQT